VTEHEKNGSEKVLRPCLGGWSNERKAYQELLDDFYEEYQDNLVSEQYRAAKDDPDYFSVPIQLAYHDQVQKNVDSEGEPSIPYFNWKLFTQI